MATSPKRIRANRRNARRSTGPTSAAGKARSRMNALKHGLDAQTLILPGEDDAAFNERLAAWRADLKPRNATEDALIAEAARLSWLLDRADRAEAAATAARLADLDDRARRQADEVEAIGQRLLDGPPVVPAPAGLPAEEAAGRRFRALMHPDDPDHPARLLGRLEATAAGCRWLLERWEELGGDLWDDETAGWRPDRRLMAVRLLGKEPIDALDDPTVRRIYLCSFVLGGEDPYILSDQADEMTKEHFRLFLSRLKARGAFEAMPSDRAAALRGLRGVVAGVLARLEQQTALHAEVAEARAALAPALEAIDTSAEGERRHRLQLRLTNAFLRTVDLLRKAQSLPASTAVDGPCEEIRNEPNAPVGSGVGQAVLPDSDRIGPDPSQAGLPDLHRPDRTEILDTNPDLTSTCEDIRNEAIPPAGWTPSSDARALNPATCTQPTAPPIPDPASGAESARNLDATREELDDCARLRNEPNADGSDPTLPDSVSASAAFSALDQPEDPPSSLTPRSGMSSDLDPNRSPGSR